MQQLALNDFEDLSQFFWESQETTQNKKYPTTFNIILILDFNWLSTSFKKSV